MTDSAENPTDRPPLELYLEFCFEFQPGGALREQVGEKLPLGYDLGQIAGPLVDAARRNFDAKEAQLKDVLNEFQHHVEPDLDEMLERLREVLYEEAP